MDYGPVSFQDHHLLVMPPRDQGRALVRGEDLLFGGTPGLASLAGPVLVIDGGDALGSPHALLYEASLLLKELVDSLVVARDRSYVAIWKLAVLHQAMDWAQVLLVLLFELIATVFNLGVPKAKPF